MGEHVVVFDETDGPLTAGMMASDEPQGLVEQYRQHEPVMPDMPVWIADLGMTVSEDGMTLDAACVVVARWMRRERNQIYQDWKGMEQEVYRQRVRVVEAQALVLSALFAALTKEYFQIP
jgi:hypothetical protein